MPEGPEAKYLAQVIHKELANKNLTSIDILQGRYKTHGVPPNYKTFIENLPMKLKRVYSKGKVIIFEFDNWYIISKLGLMGWWYSKEEPTWRKPHPNILFHFTNNTLTYSDTLSYGTLSFINDQNTFQKEINRLGVDILAFDTIQSKFIEAFESLSPIQRNKPIEEILVNQHLAVCGIGNYLKSEILYAAKISPMRKVKDITPKELQLLYKHARKIAHRFLHALSNDTYLKQFRVYKKEMDPLGNEVKTYKNSIQRTTYWVPKIQK